MVKSLNLYSSLFLCLVCGTLAIGLVACKPDDTEAPLIQLSPGADTVYVLGDTFRTPGFEITDNRDCCLEETLIAEGQVNTAKYGTYPVTYSVTDESGNEGVLTVNYTVVLDKESWYGLAWEASDACISGDYVYSANIQDCTCPENIVQAINVGNFGPGTIIDFNLGGQFGELATFLEEVGGLTFSGTATMSCAADSIELDYTVSDGAETDECSGIWLRP